MNQDHPSATRLQKAGYRSGAIAASLLLICMATTADEGAQHTPNTIKEAGMLQMTPLTSGSYHFGGEVGKRVENNIEQWLLPTPYANPKMFEMFRLRDRQPRDNQVDWAGEFAGKYLISAVQAARMSDYPALRETIRHTVSELIACQDADGYLGPWPKQERLSAHWDLWGHYHVILGLLMWHEDSGDPEALECALRAADRVCDTFLGEGKTAPSDAGWGLVNLGIIHVFGKLYRHTGNERYLDFMRLIEKNWERGDCGDLVRKGAAGIPYYQLKFTGSYAPDAPPWEGPARWETLHQLQGIVELYRITGDETYKTAFTNLWHSIRNLDVHNTGAFSTNESALGTPFGLGAIETCCHVAWQYMTEDMIALSGDSIVADEMERGFWNATLGYQHPSGRWSTYNTPCDGIREASAHSIVFQARNGSSELNCCSVNAPRGLGMLTEWALMESIDGALVINYYGPLEASLRLSDGSEVQVIQETDYPASGDIRITVKGTDRPVKLRIPAWTAQAQVSVNNQETTPATPGTYFTVEGSSERAISLQLDMTLHTWLGSEDYADCVSIYRGPLLLTFDQKYNPYDCMDLGAIRYADIMPDKLTPAPVPEGPFPPLVLFTIATADGRTAALCDFASASVYGTHYRSWLPVTEAPPSPIRLKLPEDATTIPAGTVLFTWSGNRVEEERTYHLLVAEDPAMTHVLLDVDNLGGARHFARDFTRDGKTYYWTVTAHDARGEADAFNGPCAFTVDGTLENNLDDPAMQHARADGLLVGDTLDGKATPVYGAVLEARKVVPAPDRYGNEQGAVRFNGDGMLRYGLPAWPEEAMTATFWVCPDPEQNPGTVQMFSAWSRSMDDPLRIMWNAQDKTISVGFEMGTTAHGTPCGKAEPNTWFHVAVVRDGDTVRTYLNGKRTSETVRPAPGIATQAEDFAIGANPHYGGGEFFKGCIDDLTLWNKALGDDEIARLVVTGPTK